MPGRMPSTPNTRSLRSQPSTTPAGPPPSWLTDKSTTPAGPPPPSTFGSSFNPSNNTFGRKGFSVPIDDDDEDADFEEDDDMDMPSAAQHNALMSSFAAPSPRGLKRSRDGRVRESSGMATIARGITSKSKAAGLMETEDDVIVQSERIFSDLDLKVQERPAQAEVLLTEASVQLTNVWSRYSQAATKQGGIGPRSDDAFSKANYLASLLLQLHHPHTNKPGLDSSRFQRSTTAPSRPQHSVSVPRALLNWLDTYHKPFPDDYDEVHLCSPAPSAHDAFWDVVYASALRGKFERVARLLADAGWEHAATAHEDGLGGSGYTGLQLRNVEEVALRCTRLLHTCPGLQYGDWDVKGHEWNLFRQRTRQALENLEDLAEGSNLKQSQGGENVFQRSAASSGMGLSSMSRRAESKVPWSIYENMKLLYGLLLGSVDETMMTSQDWVEASIYLTVWWDGTDDAALEASLHRMNLRKGTTREVDITPLAAYRRRLVDAFLRVTDDPEDAVFQPNTMDLVQLGLACVMEDSVGSVIGILRTWSSSITASVVEIAALGNWLPSTTSKQAPNLLDQGFSKEDLLVFSHGPIQPKADQIDRDAILGEYAEKIGRKALIREKEGWELAVAILRRLGDATIVKERIRDMMDKLDMTDPNRIDKVLALCDQLGLIELRRSLAERFADDLAERTQSYGSALIYYARAHATAKIKDTLSLLTSLCLLHSAAMPTAKVIDPELQSLLSKDRAALRELASLDLEAATLLSSHFSGYATLRRFYDLRDQDVYASQQKSPFSSAGKSLKPLERTREAATRLFNVIQAAADCIPGGLYDPATESVVPVDGVLVLFGETLPLLGQPARVFTQDQVFALLRLVEDFSRAPSRIRENADSLLSASLGAHREENSTASGILKRSKSDLSQSSWDLLATSSMLAQSQVKGAGKVERAWDWRVGVFAVGGVGMKGEQVVQLLREGLVKEVARGWGGLLNW